ncbi:MAG: arylmalonate decarboxylase, partial [Mycobacterium sp.]|nr:arylmalonate decarboxylase [Mycobacterium sp.]
MVPPSNPTVEPELDALVGDDVLVYSSRLPRYVGLSLEERNRLYAP